jgi:hypothetical protein
MTVDGPKTVRRYDFAITIPPALPLAEARRRFKLVRAGGTTGKRGLSLVIGIIGNVLQQVWQDVPRRGVLLAGVDQVSDQR